MIINIMKNGNQKNEFLRNTRHHLTVSIKKWLSSIIVEGVSECCWYLRRDHFAQFLW